MIKFALVVLLPLSVIFYGAYRPLIWNPSPEIKTPERGRLEKMIVTDGSVTIDLDLGALVGKESRQSTLYFDAERDSFFTIVVYNGELRSAMPGSIPLKPKSHSALPANLNDAYERLVVEKTEFGSDYPLVVRDGKTGFVFFNIVAQGSDYNADQRVFRSQGGRLSVSTEFARELGRPTAAGTLVGQLSLSANMRTIETAEIIDGDVVSNELPTSPLAGTVPGPDVVVGNLYDLSQWGSSATQVGLAVGTDSCNFGTQNLHWFANPQNDHPVIPQNLYRMSGGPGNDERFEQIGQSWVKHAFTALTQNMCNLGCNGVGGSNLGSGCSDPYDASLNEGPSLGSRAWINPFTGAFPRNDSATPNNSHTGHNHTPTTQPLHRILTEHSDLNTTLNSGASYYAEAQYVTPHEYAWCQANPTQCNMYNNVSYRRYTVTGTTCAPGSANCYSFSPAATTVRMQPALHAWTGSTRVEIRPDPGNDGIGSVAYKVTNPSAGVWHYEYAVYNENLDRAIQSFSVPLGSGATVSNAGFHAPPQHPGWAADGTVGNAGYSGAPWTQTQTANSMTWNTETFAQNPNANAIRWGTLYNFRFDSNKPPQAANATVGFFKTGSPMNVAIMAPADPATNLSVSGRVTSAVFRGIGIVKITLSDGVNPSRTTYTNSFGFYRFENVTSGAAYTISAIKLRHTFSSKQMAITGNLTDVNFISGQ